jgi:hypothetical protein
MKALSIRQPWADAILAGHGMTNPNVAKRVENRSKRTHFRGRFLIHAGNVFDTDGMAFVMDRYHERKLALMRPMLSSAPDRRGALLGIADLVDCVSIEDARRDANRGLLTIVEPNLPRNTTMADFIDWQMQRDWTFGPWCWVINKPVPFAKPIPYKGMLGFFDVPDAVVAEALRAA